MSGFPCDIDLANARAFGEALRLALPEEETHERPFHTWNGHTRRVRFD